MQDELPDRHHNQPPEDMALPVLPGDATPEQIARAQEGASAPEPVKGITAYDKDTHAALEAHVQVFCDAAGKWLDIKTVSNAEQSERLTDFVTGARDLYKMVEDSRKAAKKPWDDLGAQVQKAYAPLSSKVKIIAEKMKAMQADWLKRENARIAEERREAEAKARAEREAAEKAAREAAERNDISGQVEAEEALKKAEKAQKQAAKPAKARTGSATGGGRAMSLRKQKFARVINKRACFAFFQNHPDVEEVLTRLATAAVRSGELTKDTEVMAGVESFEKETAA